MLSKLDQSVEPKINLNIGSVRCKNIKKYIYIYNLEKKKKRENIKLFEIQKYKIKSSKVQCHLNQIELIGSKTSWGIDSVRGKKLVDSRTNREQLNRAKKTN